MIRIVYEQFCDLCGKIAMPKETYELVEGSVTPEPKHAPMITGGSIKYTLCPRCHTLAWAEIMADFHTRRKTDSK